LPLEAATGMTAGRSFTIDCAIITPQESEENAPWP
jgi:hypothetical protein